MARRNKWPNDVGVYNVSSLSRPEKTTRITECAQRYLIDRGFSCHVEIGVCPRGRLRADILAVTTKASLTVIEVKSCISDFRTDKKWHKYLTYCNKFYFAVDANFWSVHKSELIDLAKPEGAGILRVANDGSCSVVCNASTREVSNETLASLLIRMAWRGGRFN